MINDNDLKISCSFLHSKIRTIHVIDKRNNDRREGIGMKFNFNDGYEQFFN